ncbi:C40 family peptidase [Clostridium sp. BNL1100]|uniref:C40 family peptidase n=1 Tax=Clostridium sp. BNL1100 TaxID=755731 RepID=UPI00024A76E8|nr:C40 family peptidase [Clostridium sp. BNL1100]AEY66047.1 cell wall-associated hydrolase, invasion-associated protein [Clostridium sp. BNL1100]
MKQKITKALAGCIIALIFAFASTAVMAATMPAKVTGTNVKMRKASTTSSSIVTKLTNAKVTVTDHSKGWYKVSYNKKTGWVNGNYVKLQSVKGAINANGVNFRKSAGTSSKVISSLKKSTSVQILDVVKGWNKVKIGSKVGYVSSKFVNISSASTKTSRSVNVVAFSAVEDDGSVNSKLIAYAREFEGVRYVYGGTNPQTGFDCSGFVGYVYKKFDVNLNRSAQGMYSNGVKVAKAQLKAGDILFFDASSRKASGQIDHAGIYIGGNTFIHASSSNGKVRVQKLSEYRGTYIGAKRVI